MSLRVQVDALDIFGGDFFFFCLCGEGVAPQCLRCRRRRRGVGGLGQLVGCRRTNGRCGWLVVVSAIIFFLFYEGLQAAYQPALNVSETETSVDTLSLLDWRRGAALVFGCEGEKGI